MSKTAITINVSHYFFVSIQQPKLTSRLSGVPWLPRGMKFRSPSLLSSRTKLSLRDFQKHSQKKNVKITSSKSVSKRILFAIVHVSIVFDNSAEVVPGSGPPANDGGDINQKFEAKRNRKSNLMNFATYNQNFCWNPMFLRVLGMTTCSNTPTQSSSSTRSCKLSSRPVAVAALAPPSSCGTIFFTLCFVFFPNVF